MWLASYLPFTLPCLSPHLRPGGGRSPSSHNTTPSLGNMASATDTPKAKAPLLGCVAHRSVHTLGSANLASSSAITQGIVTIKVGSDSIEFQVHKALLTHHSGYFRKALSGPWREAQESLVALDDVESSTCKAMLFFSPAEECTDLLVTLFVHWLYTQQVPQHNEEWIRMEIVQGVDDFQEDELIHACIKAYAFADRFDISGFSRAINNCFAKTMEDVFCYSARASGRPLTKWAFENIPSDRVILQRLVEDYSQHYNSANVGYEAGAMEELPMTFLRRTIHHLHELSRMSVVAKGKVRCYLGHASDEEQKACKALHMRYNEEHEVAYFE
jgi:hypothetical protein